MALSLLAGPANAGKVALLLERYLGALESEPVLIVPNRPDVDRAERELLARAGALLGGSIGTFDDLFERIARGNGAHRPVVSEAQRTLLLRRVVARAQGRSARFAGFADALGSTVAELESALVEPGELDGELAELYAAYREELDRLGLWDRELERRYAAERVAGRARGLGRRAGLRLRLRGPDRRRVVAARGARGPLGGDGLAPLRARPRRFRVALADRRGPGGARRLDRGAAAQPRPRVRPCSRISSARSSASPAMPRRSTARFASSRAPACAGRSSSSPTRY